MAQCAMQTSMLSSRLTARRNTIMVMPVQITSKLTSNAQGSVFANTARSAVRQQLCYVPSASSKSDSQTSPEKPESDNTNTLVSLGMLALWIGLGVYAFNFAPNQTPFRDQIFIERILGLGEKDGFVINPVFYSLFNIMGIYPAVYASLLIPAARSENKIPAWPFVTMSFAVGAFALLPYFVLWQPLKNPPKLPLPKEELEGWNKLFLKGAETTILPGILLISSLYLIYNAASAGGSWWLDYAKLFDESRLVHVTTIDFLTLTLLAPFWMSNDAEARKWEQREQLIPILSVIPLLGPVTYLILRPKSE